MSVGSRLLVGAAGVVFVVLALGPLTGSGTAENERTQTLSIDPITAVFSDADRATTYSVPVHESDPSIAVSYSWTLTLEAVDPNVNVDGLTFDANCDNHGVLAGTASTFVWHHGNKGDPIHDDDCNHDLQGKYGHQGLISLTVTDAAGWRCDATYKGTFSSDADNAAGIDAQSTPVCTLQNSSPPPPPPPPPKPCKCLTLTVRILPITFRAEVLPPIRGSGPSRADMTFTIHWVMNCLPGATASCRGSLNLRHPPPLVVGGERKIFYNLGGGSVVCRGHCGGLQEGNDKVILSVLVDRAELADRRVPIVIDRTCQARRLSPIRLSLAFDGSGRPDRAGSKLR